MIKRIILIVLFVIDIKVISESQVRKGENKEKKRYRYIIIDIIDCMMMCDRVIVWKEEALIVCQSSVISCVISQYSISSSERLLVFYLKP